MRWDTGGGWGVRHTTQGLDSGPPIVFCGHSMGTLVVLSAMQFFGANALNAARVVNIDQQYALFCPSSMAAAARNAVGNSLTCEDAMRTCASIERDHARGSSATLDALVRNLFSHGLPAAEYAALRPDVLGS